MIGRAALLLVGIGLPLALAGAGCKGRPVGPAIDHVDGSRDDGGGDAGGRGGAPGAGGGAGAAIGSGGRGAGGGGAGAAGGAGANGGSGGRSGSGGAGGAGGGGGGGGSGGGGRGGGGAGAGGAASGSGGTSGAGAATPGSGGAPASGSGGAPPGSGGRAGTGGAASTGGATGTGGAACPPRFPSASLAPFRTSGNGPQAPQATLDRFYWAEREVDTFLRYAPGDPAAGPPGRYDFALTGNVDPYDVRGGDAVILRIRFGATPLLVAYNPFDGMELGRMSATNFTRAIATDVVNAYYIDKSDGTSPSRLMRWLPPNGTPTTVVSLTSIAIPGDEIVFLRLTSSSDFVMATSRDVWRVGPSLPGSKQLLLHAQSDVQDLQVVNAGVLVRTLDGRFVGGRDFYVPIEPAVGPAIDLPQTIGALPGAAPPACPASLHTYAGGGALYGGGVLYAYQADGGLFSVAVSGGAVIGPPERLTDLPLRYPVATRRDVLFAVSTDGSTWSYYRLGTLTGGASN